MNDIQYIGEHLGPRILGQFGLLTAFVCALLGLFSFYLSTRLRDEVLRAHRWRKLGRISFGLHALGLLVLVGSIIYAMLNQYYEYQYVQAHVSAELPKSLIFSAFWEGQEGSFLLWLFWHAVLGFVLMGTAKKWETPVMAVLCSAQVILTSMILGIYLGFGEHIIRLGSNPILLLREVIDAPIFNQQDYVELLSGSGLNPALQNYWMTIHPPTLFLGFASTIVPFAFAISGLWVGKHKEWLKPALKWALFSGGILGIGILMGGAWAYEALNFGGYWAWDPVENTSLVPWLLLVAGIHTNLIARATGHAIRSTYVFYLLTFVLVIYSTYLTRSGALGDTSVHAFTEMGLEPQLLFFLFGYLLLSIAMVAWRWNKIPTPQKVETTSSKEFWMFMGSMVLLLSVILISGVTSLPVVNKIAQAFDPGWADRSILDPEELHNKLQLPIAVIIATLTALAQWLRWRAESIQTHIKPFAIHQAIGIGGALFMSWLTLQWIEAPTWQLSAMLFAAWYAVIVNVDYMIAFIRKDAKVAGSSLSHIGFGLMLVGILATSVNKRILSRNDFAMEGLNLDEELSRTTLRLTMDQPAIMEDYRLTLRRDTIEDFTRTYFVDYERFDRSTGDLVETFELKPTVLYAKDFSDIVVTNPSTQRYWDKDIFTVIMTMPEQEQSIEAKQAYEDSLNYRQFDLPIGGQGQFLDTVNYLGVDTPVIHGYEVELVNISQRIRHEGYTYESGDVGLEALLRIKREEDGEEDWQEARTAMVIRKGSLFHYPAQNNEYSIRVKLVQDAFEQVLFDDRLLDYESKNVPPGEEFTIGDLKVRFLGYNPRPESDNYQFMDGDLAVGANLEVTDQNGTSDTIMPIFLVRQEEVMPIRAESRQLGFFANFTGINTDSDEGQFFVAVGPKRPPINIPIEVGTGAFRTDYIGIQAIEFPGINLFWFGALSMMLGMLINLVIRLRRGRAG